MAPYRKRRRLGAGAAALTLIALALGGAAPASAAFDDPIFTGPPLPPPPPAEPVPPPTGYLNGPCGLAVDSAGDIYVADHHHDAVQIFSPGFAYRGQLSVEDPCYLALDSADRLYVGAYHGAVRRYQASPSFGPGALIDPGPVSGIAVDPATDRLYLNHRDRVSAYDSAGNRVMDGAEPLAIGTESLGEGYGLAVSTHPATGGWLYAPDAQDDVVEVFHDPGGGPESADEQLSGPAAQGGFSSLREAAVAVDRLDGDVYVVDYLGPGDSIRPEGVAYAFDPGKATPSHLKYRVVHGEPAGIAVDNTALASRGRVYLSSGNTDRAGVYAYPPGAGTSNGPFVPTIPPEPAGGGLLFATIGIGGPAPPPSGIPCEGDACQVLPPEPVDPTLTTRLPGLGNPKPRYRSTLEGCARKARRARRLARKGRGLVRRAKRSAERRRAARLRSRAGKLKRRAARAARGAKRCRGGSGASAPASASYAVQPAVGVPSAGTAARGTAPASASPGGWAQALAPLPGGFAVELPAEGDAPAIRAGSHPYRLSVSFALDPGSGPAELRELRFDLPAGLLANPAAAGLCQSSAFASGGCPVRSQVGTLELSRAGPETRRFALFSLDPADGAAMALGAIAFGEPLIFEAALRAGGADPFGLSLAAREVPASLEATALGLTLWGTPGEAVHDAERGSCLKEEEPSFALCKRSIGEPLAAPPLAYLTLPTRCEDPLAFAATAEAWQGRATSQAVQLPALEDCDTLGFDPATAGLLSVKKASSVSGFVFRLENRDLEGSDTELADPGARIRSHAERAVVELPEGVTINPSVGAGLEGCTLAQFERESAFNAPGEGCPNGAKIGSFQIRSPFYEGLLEGGVYLAEPRRNPFGSLLAIYLVAKSADRGILITAAGELRPDPGDGTLTAVLDDLPQLPYTDLEVSMRSGQRAPLVSPPACGPARTRVTLTPSAQGAPSDTSFTDSDISAGIGFGPCPDGEVPPFAPGVIAGGVNANVGSYTPYFVHLTRRDTEQEITSYSLILPEGVVGKLAGIPFCPEAAIAAARAGEGFDEIRDPSCPAASQVGRTLTGYGVGSALTYAPGRIYLAGPYNGRPLSLVTVNATTVGPFDLGTVVVRSAFSVDPRTAQLAIDSGASDPIPHILAGIPLHLRDVRVYVDRPHFTRNPTGCEASRLVSTLTGSGARFGDLTDDALVTVSEHFQLLNCLDLGFRPRLGLRLHGGARRGAYPGLRAVYGARGGDADLKRIAVTMPPSLFLAQNHIRGVCTRVQFAAEACPPGSIYGRAAAHTPLFDEPLRGPVVLRSSDHKLPDLIADLRAGEVRIVLEGRIGPSKRGGIRAFFDAVPDAPVERFAIWLRGGRHGLLVNSVDVCKRPPSASVKALAHNNRGAIFATELRAQCGRKRKKQGRGGPGTTATASEAVQKGDLRVTTTGKLRPRKLPRTGTAPIALTVAGQIERIDGAPPPQLRSLRIELNRHGRLETRGLPVCRPTQIHPASTARALRACRGALVGRGSFSVDVVLAGQEPYPTRGTLLVFNGAYKGRKALLGQIYSPKPFSTSFFVPFAIGRTQDGRYGTALTASLPRALGRWGHVTGIQMRLGRRYRHRGRPHSLISAGCPAPRGFPGALFTLARTTFGFAGKIRLTSTLTRECRVGGRRGS